MIDEIIAEYQQLLAQVDEWFNRAIQPIPQHIACHQGCSGCCRGLFDITLLDSYLLQLGFNTLPAHQQHHILQLVAPRLQQLQQLWPDFQYPYILNHLPHQQWQEMPEDDMTPCPLLTSNGLCLIYRYRPLTCRLHGIPQIDTSGELFSDTFCNLNFTNIDPLTITAIRGEFAQLFQREVDLLSQFSKHLTGHSQTQLDTFIPTSLLIDFTKQL